MALLLLAVLCCVAAAELVIPAPHPFAGRYQLTRFRAYGWQSFQNVSLTLATVVDVPTALSFCTDNRTALAQFRGRMVGLVYPFFTSDDPYTVLALGGCAAERIFSVAAEVGVAGVLMFQDPINSGLPQLLWSRCRNCSIFSGTPISFPCVYALGTQGSTGPWTPIWYNYITQGNATLPAFPDVDVILVGPDESHFEVLTPPVGYTFQVVLALWALANVLMAAIFIVDKLPMRPRPVLALAALSLELVCNLWRFSFLVVDPWLLNSIYPVPYFAIIGGYIFSVSCVATWLIACFWLELTFLWRHGPRRRPVFRAVLVVLVCVGSVAILVAEFLPRILSIYGNLLEFQEALRIFFSVQVALHVSLGLFFLVSGVLVLWIFSAAATYRASNAGTQQQAVARFLVVDAVLLFCIAGYSGILLADGIFYEGLWFSSNIGLAFLYSALSTSQIMIFRKKFVEHDTSATTSNDPNSSSGGSRSRLESLGLVKLDVAHVCCCCWVVTGDAAAVDNDDDSPGGGSSSNSPPSSIADQFAHTEIQLN